MPKATDVAVFRELIKPGTIYLHSVEKDLMAYTGFLVRHFLGSGNIHWVSFYTVTASSKSETPKTAFSSHLAQMMSDFDRSHQFPSAAPVIVRFPAPEEEGIGVPVTWTP